MINAVGGQGRVWFPVHPSEQSKSWAISAGILPPTGGSKELRQVCEEF